jgi:hypothetical protein
MLLAALLAASPLLGACGSRATTEADVPSPSSEFRLAARPGQEFTVANGTVVDVADLGLVLRVMDLTDSRCPTKALVQCVWAGSVRVHVQASQTPGFAVVQDVYPETAPNRESVTVFGRTLTLVRVTPEKETLDEIPKGEYRLTFRVSAQ